MRRKQFVKFVRWTSGVLVIACVVFCIWAYPRVRPVILDHELVAACSSGNTTRVESLLNEGVDPNHRICYEYIDITEAITGHHIDSDDRCPPLNYAAFAGQTTVAEILIKHGATVDEVCSPSDGVTPLMAAIMGKHDDMVRLLISHHANVNAHYEDNSTVLDSGSDEKIIKMLKAAGAKGEESVAYRDDDR